MTPRDLAAALGTWTNAIVRARADYIAHPTRSCHLVEYRKPCDQLRVDDPYYCPTHRRERDAANERRRA